MFVCYVDLLLIWDENQALDSQNHLDQTWKEHQWVGGSFWGWHCSKSVLNFWNGIMYLLSKFRVHYVWQTFNSCAMVEWTEGCLLRRRVARNSSLALPRCVFEWWLFKTPRCLLARVVGWKGGAFFYSHPSRSTMNCIEYGVEHLRERWPSQNWNCGTVVDLTHRGASNWLKPAPKDIGRWHPAQFFHPSSMNCMMERCAFCLFFLWRMVAVFFVDDMVGGWLGGQRWTSQEFEWIAQDFLHFTLESRTLQEKVYRVNLQTKR